VGVYCTVKMCVQRDTPLDVDRRVALVSLCVEHHLLGKKLGKSLGHQVQVPTGGTSFDRGVKVVDKAAAGFWLEARAREIGTDFIIGCDGPFWQDDDSGTQGFRYAALSAAADVRTFNAYRSPNQRSRFEDEDGYVGSFFDVLALDARNNLDGRIAASSPFVRALKAKLGVKMTCRASWW